MLATLGCIVQDVMKFPGASTVYAGDLKLTKLHDAAVEQGTMGQMLVWLSFLEIFGTAATIQMLQVRSFTCTGVWDQRLEAFEFKIEGWRKPLGGAQGDLAPVRANPIASPKGPAYTGMRSADAVARELHGRRKRWRPRSLA